MHYGIATDYDYSATHKRQRLTIWSGSFASTYEGEALSLKDGFMVTTYEGDKVRVTTAPERDGATYIDVDNAIRRALDAHYIAKGYHQAFGIARPAPILEEVTA